MTEIGWSATKTRCARGASAGKKAAGVTEAQQAANLKLAYHCLSFYPYVRAALWFSLRDTVAADTEIGRYGLQRFDGSRRPAFDALAHIAKTGTAPGNGCGDFTAPDVRRPRARDRRRVRPVPRRSRSSRTTTTASSAASRSTRTARRSAASPGTRCRTTARSGSSGWARATCPYGPVNVKVEALDEFGNTTHREVPVRRVDPASMPAQRPVVGLRLSGKGLKRRVRGTVSAPRRRLPADRQGRHRVAVPAQGPLGHAAQAQQERQPPVQLRPAPAQEGRLARRRPVHRRQAVPLGALQADPLPRPLSGAASAPSAEACDAVARCA